MTTNLSNLSSSELRTLASGTGTLSEAARRVLAERAAAEARLEANNRAGSAVAEEAHGGGCCCLRCAWSGR